MSTAILLDRAGDGGSRRGTHSRRGDELGNVSRRQDMDVPSSRSHVWSDGLPVTAADFVFAWQRLLDPRTGAAYAYNLWVVKNAHAISEGKSCPRPRSAFDAPDDKTLVVELEHPASYLPELLTHDTDLSAAAPCTAAPKVMHGPTAGTSSATAPYVPTQWIANDHITLVKNPRFYDARACPHRRRELLSDLGQ